MGFFVLYLYVYLINQKEIKIMKALRKWAIRQGLIAPKDLKETQELFPFPVKLTPSPKTIRLGSHIQKVL